MRKVQEDSGMEAISHFPLQGKVYSQEAENHVSLNSTDCIFGSRAMLKPKFLRPETDREEAFLRESVRRLASLGPSAQSRSGRGGLEGGEGLAGAVRPEQVET